MSEFMYGLRIPKERIPVLIGTQGAMKKQLQEDLGITLNVDSDEGDVQITGDDALSLYAAREVIRAISRGFNPEVAMDLKKADYSLEIVELKEFAKSKKQLIRKRGRVIGEKGRARTTLEHLTDTRISVYGKTIAIIGRVEDTLTARKAISALLEEAPHAGVYKTLEKHRAKMKRDEALWKREAISLPDELRD